MLILLRAARSEGLERARIRGHLVSGHTQP